MLIDLCKTVFKTKYVPGKLETVAYRASAGECGRNSELDSAQAQLAIHIMLNGQPPEACGMLGTCGMQYVVEADGSVYPCDFYMLDQYKLGNLNTDTLAQIDARRKEIGFIEQSCAVDEKCKICRWYQLCRGGCRRDRDYYQDGIGRNYYCTAYEHFFEYAWPKLGAVYEKVVRG